MFEDECLRTRRGGGNVLHIADSKEILEMYFILRIVKSWTRRM
jgi:hypothetical protein